MNHTSSLHKRNGSNNNNNGGSSSSFFSEEEESSSSPLKSPMTATAAAPSHRVSNNGSSIGGSSSVLLRSSPRSSPNNKSSSITNMNSKEKKNKTSAALLIKYLFLAILILLVYFLLRINLQLIQRIDQNNSIATTVNGKQVGGKSSPLRARSSSNNDAAQQQQEEEEEGQDAEKLLQTRLVTLRSEVATMQKKVNDMKNRIGHIKDIRKSSSAALFAAAAAGTTSGGSVELSTKKNNDNNEELLRHTCTPDQTTLQTQRLQKRFAEWWSHSACPDQIWMEHIDDLFAQATPPPSQPSSSQNEQQPYLILDIGCNKGYTSADFLDALSPGTNMNPSTLVTAIRSVAKEDNTKYDRDGGVCNDSKKTLNEDRRTVRDVEVHCFEPSPATYDMLTRVHDKLMSNENEEEGEEEKKGGGGARWFIHNKGLHKVNGEMTWHSACAHAVGDELCTIVEEGTKDAITVPVVTVDKFLEETYPPPPSSLSSSTLDSSSSLPLVHMLKIDAEGLDPAVLEGSRNLLTQNRAIMVMFEFNPGLSEKGDHPHGMWGKKGNPHVTLLQVTNWLDTLGYDCYLDTHVPDEQEKKKDTRGVLEEAPGLYRITGDCLSKEPSVRGWANVVCACRKYGVVAKRLLELATIVTT